MLAAGTHGNPTRCRRQTGLGVTEEATPGDVKLKVLSYVCSSRRHRRAMRQDYAVHKL